MLHIFSTFFVQIVILLTIKRQIYERNYKICFFDKKQFIFYILCGIIQWYNDKLLKRLLTIINIGGRYHDTKQDS